MCILSPIEGRGVWQQVLGRLEQRLVVAPEQLEHGAAHPGPVAEGVPHAQVQGVHPQPARVPALQQPIVTVTVNEISRMFSQHLERAFRIFANQTTSILISLLMSSV